MTYHQLKFLLHHSLGFENVQYDNYWTFWILTKTISDLQIKALCKICEKNKFVVTTEIIEGPVIKLTIVMR